MQTTQIPLSSLTIDKFNPRRIYDEKKVKALAAGIKAQGIISPLVVRPMPPEGAAPTAGVVSLRYSVLCGSRRVKAAELLELKEVPCVVRTLTDAEAAELAITEQDANEKLHFLELAEHISRWKEAGQTPEEIGKRLDRKRAWVYATLPLTKLSPEVKKACWDGRLEESTARDLATVHGSAQSAALKKCLEPGMNGPKTVRECREEIAKFRVDLTRAPFDLDDATLKTQAHAGPCTTCEFRTGNSPDLFTDEKNPNLCMHPEGYRARAELAWLRMVDDGEHNRGPKCLLAKQADRFFDLNGKVKDDSPYVNVQEICHEDISQRPYAMLIGKASQRYRARSPKTLEVVELLERAKLEETLDQAGKIRRRPKPAAAKAVDESQSKLSADERREQARRVERRLKVTRKAIGALVSKVETREPDRRFWRALADSLVHMGGLEQIWIRRDVQEGPAKYLDRLDGPKLRGFVYEAVLEYELYGEAGKYAERLLEQSKLYAVDVKEFEREVVADERAQPEVKKPEAAEEKKPEAKKTESKPAPKPKKGAKK